MMLFYDESNVQQFSTLAAGARRLIGDIQTDIITDIEFQI